MPILTFEGGKLSPDARQKLIEGLTASAAEATGIPEEKFIVLLRELDDLNIGVGGKNLADVKKGVAK